MQNDRAPPSQPLALPASVLVTGAEGGLGRRTMRALAHLPLVQGLDRVATSLIQADLTAPADTWRHHLQGVDVLVHLAGEPSHTASRAAVERDNIGVTRALLQAAAEAHVRRVVFASSCHVLGGYRFGTARLRPDTPAFPVSPYGWSKHVSEENGRLWAEETGGTFLSLRIGFCPRESNVHFSPTRLSRWIRSKLLTAEDYAQAVFLATTADVTGYHAMTICSAVEGSRWDHSAAREIIGYRPTPLPAPAAGPLLRLAELRDRAQNWWQGGPRRYG